jgi:hypothetical protein
MFIASPNNERRRRRNGVHTTAEYTRPLFENGHPLSADVGHEAPFDNIVRQSRLVA